MPQPWEDELQDTWARSTLSIPAISFADHRKGEGVVDGILLPTPSGKYAGRGYYETPVMHKQFLENGEENPDFGKPRRWKDGRLMQQTVLTLLTPLKTLDFDGLVGEKALKRIETARSGADAAEVGFLDLVQEWGLRRLFIQGESMDQGFAASVRAVSKMPMPGGTVTCVIDALEPNKHGGRTKIYMVKYGVPTSATLARVEEYLRKAAPAVNDFLHLSETAEKTAQAAAKPEEKREYVPDEDEPPF